MDDKIKTEDERIRDSEYFLFEFEGFLYYTDIYISGRDRLEITRVKEKRLGIHRKSITLGSQEFLEILRPYLKEVKK